jgi:hypothetical protein
VDSDESFKGLNFICQDGLSANIHMSASKFRGDEWVDRAARQMLAEPRNHGEIPSQLKKKPRERNEN